MFGQLLATSPGEDVGTLLEQRCRVRLRTLSTLKEWGPEPGSRWLGCSNILTLPGFLLPHPKVVMVAPQLPTTHSAVWTDKATHVLHDTDHPQPYLPTEGQLPPHVPHGHCLQTREEVGKANGHPEHSTKMNTEKGEEPTE